MQRVRRIGYSEAEGLTIRLAAALRDAAGPDLPGHTFVPIPRGGLFVLGMLSYALDLEAPQVRSLAGTGHEPVVLVDDCALSGARLARALDELGAASVVVGHLLSHPELRRAVERDEPRVERCVAAADLEERGDAPPREAFGETWRPRLPGRRYWLGAVEPIAFPWSEPEAVWWNARDGRLEDGWRRASPRSCLRSRCDLELPQPERPPGPLDLAEGLLWKLDSGRLLVRPTGGSGRILGFGDVALDMWRALLAFGDLDRAADHLASLYDADPDELEADLRTFAGELVDRGLLAGASTGSGGR